MLAIYKKTRFIVTSIKRKEILKSIKAINIDLLLSKSWKSCLTEFKYLISSFEKGKFYSNVLPRIDYIFFAIRKIAFCCCITV